jgi:hypothetical protein
MMPTDEGYFAACSGAPWSGYFGRGLRGKPKFSCFDTSSMFCDENHPTDWPLLTLTAWCLPGSIHLAPGVLNALKIVKSETVIRWHRTGFRAYWRRRSGPREGRPQIPLENADSSAMLVSP